MTREAADDVTLETVRLIERVKGYVKYTWDGMAKALSGHGFEINKQTLQNVGLGRTAASPQLAERVRGLAKQVGLKGLASRPEAECDDVPAFFDLAVPMLSMGIGRDDYERTQRDFSGYYIGIRANEAEDFVCSWTKLLSLREAIGVPRFNTWRPDDKDGCVITTGYYFSSTQFLYMISHPINDVSIRYSVVRRDHRGGLVGITTGVSPASAICSTNIYLKRVADIDDERVSRVAFLGQLGEFSTTQIREKFPAEVEVILAHTSMVKPRAD